MENKIFFSYAWRDMGIAQRICSDLKRSGVNVWRDRVDSPPTGNFREQYLKEIDNCSHFIMLDTENYRKHSNWCKDEIDRFIAVQKKDPNKNLVICVVAPKGETPDGEWRKVELIPDQKLQKYFDFSITNKAGCTYDNESKYKRSIIELCKVFDKTYNPWIEKDCEQDILDEISELKTIGLLSEEDRHVIISDYENLRYLWTLKRPTTESRIRNFITDCKSVSYNAYTPHMLLLDYLSAQNRFNDCEGILRELIKDFDNEPRAYRWLGTVCLHLNKYDEALLHYNKSIEMSNNPKHKKQKDYFNTIILNICAVYIKQKKYQSALSKLSELDNKQNDLSKDEYVTYIEYQAFCNTKLNNTDINYNLLNDALQKYSECSKFYEWLGHYYLKQNAINMSIEMYQSAIRNIEKNDISISDNINYYASLAQAYSLSENKQEEIKKIRMILQTEYLDVFDNSILTDGDRENIRLVDSYLVKKKWFW